MIKEDFEKEANKWADGMVWALVDTKRKANDDERDFLVQEYKDLQKRFTKELEHQLTHRNCLDCSNHSSNLRMRNLDLEKENAELKRIVKMVAMINKDIYTEEGIKAIYAEAEHFFKDCEVEK